MEEIIAVLSLMFSIRQYLIKHDLKRVHYPTIGLYNYKMEEYNRIHYSSFMKDFIIGKNGDDVVERIIQDLITHVEVNEFLF